MMGTDPQQKILRRQAATTVRSSDHCRRRRHRQQGEEKKKVREPIDRTLELSLTTAANWANTWQSNLDDDHVGILITSRTGAKFER